MTSVKDFRVEEEPTATDLGRGRFVFSDRYSVFDWGEMPDHVPNKGASLCLMGAYNFELLDVNHVPTHYLGVVEDGEVKELGECESPPTEMAIELTQVPDLPHADGAYDYDAYHEAAGDNYLIPLEIVFRNTVPVGSSLRRRGDPADYGLELDEWPDEAVSLPEPVVELSTKYEEQDRYLSRAEADDIAGKVDLDRLEELALAVNHVLTERADEAGFDHEDGKIECLYHDGTVKVGDVVGTFDENRFSYGGQQVSKEVVRQYYKRVQPEWVEAVKDAKAEAIETGEPNWREHCAVEPDRLPADIVEALSDLYCAGTNAYVDHDWFDAPTIEDAVARVRDL
ncbi:phosphoribosylaminoimidazolesuccinocarboxamide synthase [Haloferax volcanii]|uniref:phosphoribosylaminoimidazolesuccinocarboxamide synthase n=2 Tax=Haloferax volcanii TaxID=2246 RepID=A0A6C0UUL8_HALVO|nr:phosphoribosylaminoimidazolesuccinocarboxamide synthase [Haloferax alexandrinus]ELZ88050.1 phosphoribosylaminoimidazole-succinocarboxamide synthase [Haloferax alexandrinus JCM 10717]NLV03768.1 phosphoribosylaminoimidazolesuccinocarboxamide synthase [Haloferax alexandrinus]QIB79236.1 phosphoribosylaminoimidazolesuccinocarboxamide synthase [Haloferax alexandrinus]